MNKKPQNTLLPKIIEDNTKKNSLNLAMVSLGVLLLTLLVILWPLATIWALNTLFQLAIPFNFWMWLSCWIILFSINGATRNTRN